MFVADISVFCRSLFSFVSAQEWWTDLWLNEGFASWIEYPCLERFMPEYHTWQQIFSLEYARALSLDSLKSSHPIEVQLQFSFCSSFAFLLELFACMRKPPILIIRKSRTLSRRLSVPIDTKRYPGT